MARIGIGVAGFIGKLRGQASHFNFRAPSKSSVVIFDRVGSDRIIQFLLYGIDYAILDVRKRVYYLNARILFHLMRRLMRAHREFPTYKNESLSYIRSAINSLHTNNLLSFLDYMNPKIIITGVDNSGQFHRLSREYEGPIYIAVQNGLRAEQSMRSVLPPIKKFPRFVSKSHYFSFGPYTEDVHQKYGHEVANFHPVGAMLSGHFLSEMRASGQVEKRFDLCIVSQWRENIEESRETINGENNRGPLFLKCLHTINDYIRKYTQEKTAKLCVALATVENREKEFFMRDLGEDLVMIEQNRKEMSTYRAMGQSGVVIGINSAALFEALGLGNRVLFCNFTGVDAFDPPRLGPWSINEPDYALFKEKVDFLMDQSDEDFQERNRDFIRYVMANDPDHPPHVVIREMIERILASDQEPVPTP